MSITRLQQARQMYATGQRVGRVAFQGGGADQGDWSPGPSKSQGPAGGSSAGGKYGGDSSGGVSARDMSNTRNEGPAGTRPGPSGGDARDRARANMYANMPTPTTTVNTVNPHTDGITTTNVPTTYQRKFASYGNPGFGLSNQGPTLGQKIGQGIGNLASGVGDYFKSGGMWGAAARGLGSLFSGIGFKSNLERRKDFMTKYNTSVPPIERLDMTEDDILSAEGLDALKELGYKTISDMPTGPQNDGGIPLWAQLGYPSYEAWASAQNIPVEDTIDDTETEDFVWRFAGNQPEDVVERIEEQYKDYYTT
jgi:hypothetical protein